jgi:hypothetical protein
MRILLERDKNGEFNLNIPEWIASQLGDRLILDYDGVMVRLWSAA